MRGGELRSDIPTSEVNLVQLAIDSSCLIVMVIRNQTQKLASSTKSAFS